MNPIIRQIPNSITCLNILSGCAAIVLASYGTGPMAGMPAIFWAFIAIGIAAVADFCDGLAARLLHAYSELGKQLDSLCDAVSFGVAPAMALYHYLSATGSPLWTAMAAMLIPVAGVLRLAKFNIDTRQTTSFIGLPIPANAIFWIGYISMAARGAEFLTMPWVLIPVIVCESWLMVSPLRIFSLKASNLRWKGNEARWMLIAAAAVLIPAFGTGGLLWLVIFYVILSMFPFSRRQ